MSERSLYQAFEDAAHSYYDTDRGPEYIIPSVADPNVAHELAVLTEEQLGRINDVDILIWAVGAHSKQSPRRGVPERTVEDFMDDRYEKSLLEAVQRVETRHAILAPKDFNSAAQETPAYLIATGVIGGQYYVGYED